MSVSSISGTTPAYETTTTTAAAAAKEAAQQKDTTAWRCGA